MRLEKTHPCRKNHPIRIRRIDRDRVTVEQLIGAGVLAATLREQWDDAMLYRDLARLRTTADGVPIAQASAAELRWDGAPRDRWEAFCDEWGLARLRSRPHRWFRE